MVFSANPKHSKSVKMFTWHLIYIISSLNWIPSCYSREQKARELGFSSLPVRKIRQILLHQVVKTAYFLYKNPFDILVSTMLGIWENAECAVLTCFDRIILALCSWCHWNRYQNGMENPLNWKGIWKWYFVLGKYLSAIKFLHFCAFQKKKKGYEPWFGSNPRLAHWESPVFPQWQPPLYYTPFKNNNLWVMRD